MIEDRLQGSMIALHGPPKVGKTQLCSKFPGPVKFIAVEYGHKFIPQEQRDILLQIPADNGWQTFKDAVNNKSIVKEKPKTFVIDTVSGLYTQCFEYVCQQKKFDHPSDDGHGKGWAAVRREFTGTIAKLVDQLNKIGATFICIDHSKEERIETTTGVYNKVTFAMTGQARDIVLRVPDHMWFLGYAEDDPSDARRVISDKRALFVRGSSAVEAGTRDDKASAKIIMPLSKKNPYKQILQELYGKETKE